MIAKLVDVNQCCCVARFIADFIIYRFFREWAIQTERLVMKIFLQHLLKMAFGID